MIELERTYLAQFLPEDLRSNPSEKIIDGYVEDVAHHPTLRLRRKGDSYEITRKKPIDNNDRSRQTEITIDIDEVEFQHLFAGKHRVVEKTRYRYAYKGVTAEIDVFEGELLGLVTVDVEFETEEEKASFDMPDFCLADVTQEDFIAGGALAGKTYLDIEKELERFDYKKLSV